MPFDLHVGGSDWAVLGLRELQGPGIPAGGMRRWQATGLYWKGMLAFVLLDLTCSYRDAQQVIHPNQVATVNSSFVPTFHGEVHICVLSLQLR